MADIEEMTERNPSLSGIARTGGEGTRRGGDPFRVGRGIAGVTSRLSDEEIEHFSP